MTRYLALALAGLLATQICAEEPISNPMVDGPTWPDIQYDLLGDVALADGSGVLNLEAPYRAHDAATVPVILRQTDPSQVIKRAMLVIDENPAPMAGDFHFGAAMHPLDLEVRVRVNQYSNVRVIAETPEGKVMSGRYVKASGGCSAPATGDMTAALDSMGQMRLRHFLAAKPVAISTPRRQAQIMIRHPNYSGLQRDQITHLFINAHFIDHLEVYQGEELLFTMEGGISISENPVFRFSYNDNGATDLLVRARDTEGNVFEQSLPKGSAI